MVKAVCTDSQRLHREDRVDDFPCRHNRIGVVQQIDVESGVHLLIVASFTIVTS